MWSEGQRLRHEFRSRHVGHLDIGQQQMDRTLVLRAEMKGFRAPGGFQDPVPISLKDQTHVLPHGRIVVYEEDGLRIDGRSVGCIRRPWH